MNPKKTTNIPAMCLSAITGFFLLLSTVGARGETLAVITPDSPLPSIVTTDNITEKAAAADLADYLSRISGRAVSEPVGTTAAAWDHGRFLSPVIIHVGRDAFVREHAPEIESLFADGYIIKALTVDGRDHLILAGRLPRAAQWAVERLLMDYCGVRWLFPDETYGEVVPSQPTVTVPRELFLKQEPDYLHRGNLGMYQYGYKDNRYITRDTMRLGPYGYQYGEHMIQRMFTRKEYEENPEWFAFFTLPEGRANQIAAGSLAASEKAIDAINRGERRGRWHWDYGNGWQICSTNPGTVEHAVAWVLDYFENNPDMPMVSVGNNDGWGECECSECAAFLASADPAHTVSERWWNWVNQVAKEVGKVHPGKWVESLAYSQTSSPPRFQLEPNVAVTKAIVLDSELKQAEEWGKVCQSVNLYSYLWGSHVMGFRHYPQAMQDFLKWGREDLGARAHAPESAGNWTFDGPKYHYVQALQWDVNADVDALMEDFCKHSYGAAAGPMRAFWDRHEEVWENREPGPRGREGTRFLFYQWPGWSLSSYLMPNHEFEPYSSADVEFLDRRIAEAEDLAADESEAVRFRTEKVADGWRFLRTMLLSKLNYYDRPEIAPVTDRDSRMQALAQAREIAGLRADRIKHLGKLRRHPHIDPHLQRDYHWGMARAYTLFSHEQAHLDGLCTAVSEHIAGTEGEEAVRAFWLAAAPEEVLYESARTQLYLLDNPVRPNLLANGDFEDGSLEGWTTGGAVSLSADAGPDGSSAARMAHGTLSQNVEVSPLARYRLTARVKYAEASTGDSVPVEMTPQFFSGTRALAWFEPLRAMARTMDPADGWPTIAATMTAPPEADRATITLEKRSSSGVALWDDVVFELIEPGPEVAHDVIVEDFSGARLAADRWTRIPVSAGFEAPALGDGWLTFSPDTYPVVSLASFNELLEYTGEERYRLRFRVAPLPGEAPATFAWGIQNGARRLSTDAQRYDEEGRYHAPGVLFNAAGTGPYWTYRFAPDGETAPRLVTFAYQAGNLAASALAHPEQLKGREQEDVWFTLYFDPEAIIVYASAEGYDETEASLVGEFEHGMTNLTANGDVYLKLDGENCRLAEISLTRE